MDQQETKFNTSFIPKKNIAANYNNSGITKKGPSLLTIIGTFLFLIAVIGVAGVYGWKYYMETTITSQIETLRQVRGQFDERTIAEATRLNKKINAVKTLLVDHVAPTTIFKILEEKTLTNVSYRTYSYETGTDGKILIKGSGIAKELNSVVLQSDELGNSDFRDVLFSNIQNTNEGMVTFSFEASVDKSVILFNNKVSQAFSFINEYLDTN